MLHNMTVEDERDENLENHDFQTRDDDCVPSYAIISRDSTV